MHSISLLVHRNGIGPPVVQLRLWKFIWDAEEVLRKPNKLETVKFVESLCMLVQEPYLLLVF